MDDEDFLHLSIIVTLIRVNKDGYTRQGYYYGAGQNGHEWELVGHTLGLPQLKGFVRGGDGRTTRKEAISQALAVAVGSGFWKKDDVLIE